MAFLPVAIFGYTIGIVLASVVTVQRSATARRWASIVFVLTWLAHLAAVIRQSLATGGLPLSNMAEYLLVLGWVVLTLHLFLWFRLHVDAAGLMLLPIAALCTFGALQLLTSHAVRVAAKQGFWFVFHTTVSTVGMAILCVAFAMSVIYLLQDRALKSRKGLRLLERLPSLEQSDKIGFQALSLGFLLLTLGIGTGLMINAAVHDTLWMPGAKQIFPFLAWGVFAAILLARTALGFRGRKSAYLTITGFAFGLLTVLGMTL